MGRGFAFRYVAGSWRHSNPLEGLTEFDGTSTRQNSSKNLCRAREWVRVELTVRVDILVLEEYNMAISLVLRN
jgi:hypothetical protein